MSKSEDFWMVDLKRDIQNIRSSCMANEFSCERPPLLTIPLDNIVLDELHLMLRITGRLLIANL